MRTLHVSGAEQFRISVPDDAKVYLGPLVPKKDVLIPEGAKITNLYMQQRDDGYHDGRTTPCYALHVEDPDGSKIACIPGVTGFRDLAIDYTQKVATEEGTTVWKSDNAGYSRQESVRRQEAWEAENDKPKLTPPASKRGKK